MMVLKSLIILVVLVRVNGALESISSLEEKIDQLIFSHSASSTQTDGGAL